MRPAPSLVAALIALLALPSVAAAQPAGGTLQAAVSVPAGYYPYSIAIGNFNGDGAPDVAVTNLGTGVSVLLGRGDGSFEAPVRYPAGSYPHGLALGDLNGDLRDDLVVTQYSGGISVVLGNGDGTFRAPVHYDAGGSSVLPAIADFDGDGARDVAAGTSTGRVALLLNNGDGTLRNGPVTSDRPYPSSLAAADFDGDGRQDLAVVSNGAAGTTVLRGNGDGTVAAASFHAGRGGTAIATGDFDGDGTLDIAVGGTSEADVSVFLGRGDATFQAGVRHGPGLLPMAIAAGDLNGDGLDDLAVVTYELRGKTGVLEHGEIAVLLAGGAGAFLPAVHYAAGQSPRSIFVGDVNGDDRPDVLAANALGFDISVLLNGPATQTTAMHVGNLRGHAQLAQDGVTWNAQVLVRAERAGHRALPGTIVSGTWSDGTAGACVTGTKGTCTVTRFGLAAALPAITFTVTMLENPTHPEHAYDAAGNHDLDGDSDGTSVVVSRPDGFLPDSSVR
jgi:hypothetical protein